MFFTLNSASPWILSVLSFLCHGTNNGRGCKERKNGWKKMVWRGGGARRDSLGFAPGGFVKAARDRVPPLVVVGVALPKPTRAASEAEPHKNKS
jgi:hypothetical protein